MSNYLENLHTNQIRFPKAYDQFLRNLFYMADSLKDEEEIRMNITMVLKNIATVWKKKD